MDDQLARLAAELHCLLPGEVVVVLDLGDAFQAERRAERVMQDVVARRGEPPDEFHARPIRLAKVALELQPGEVAELARQECRLARQLRVAGGDLCADAPAARVRQEREVLTRRDAERLGAFRGSDATVAPLLRARGFPVPAGTE